MPSARIRAGHPTPRASLGAVGVLFAGVSACVTGPTQDPTGRHADVSDASTVVAPASSATDPAPVGSAASGAADGGGEPAGTTIPRANECVGESFDIDALLSQASAGLEERPDGGTRTREALCSCDDEQALRLAGLGGPDAISVEVRVDPPAVAPGGRAKLLVTFKNATSAPRTVVFDRCAGDPSLSVEAHQGSVRADLAPSDFGCGVSRGCLLQRAAVTLAPGGIATTRGDYRAQRLKLFPPCEEKPIGALPVGKYSLQVTTPLQFLDSPAAVGGVPRTAEAELRVGR